MSAATVAASAFGRRGGLATSAAKAAAARANGAKGGRPRNAPNRPRKIANTQSLAGYVSLQTTTIEYARRGGLATSAAKAAAARANGAKGGRPRKVKPVELVRIKNGQFFRDHDERALATPVVVKGNTKYLWIDRHDPALGELIDDAKHYAHANGPDMCPRGLVMSAKALLDTLQAAGVEI